MTRRDLVKSLLGLACAPIAALLPQPKKDEWFVQGYYTVEAIRPRASFLVIDDPIAPMDREAMKKELESYEKGLQRYVSCRTVEITPTGKWWQKAVVYESHPYKT